MTLRSRLGPALIAIFLAGCVAQAATHRIDGTLPDGGDCPAFGTWNAATSTCRIDDAIVQEQEWLLIDAATVDVVGTLTNEGLLENRGLLLIHGFVDSTSDLVNNWDGTTINRGEFFSHFMYNFGGLTNESSGSIEFELHLENNAPMINHGHIDLGGNYFNIPGRLFANFGSLDISPTGNLVNSGTMIHTGRIENLGALQNDAELIEHCDSVLSGNAVSGLATTPAQSMRVTIDTLEWCSIDGASGYDVVRGDLQTLRSSAGDFAPATTDCLADGVGGTSIVQPAPPEPDRVWWFLVRANDVTGAGFDTVFDSQVGEREAGITASAGACP
ncbi:MAG: hypothetical protein GY716_21020 [bacterium]|nr:hypothetical protein [bacterium]